MITLTRNEFSVLMRLAADTSGEPLVSAERDFLVAMGRKHHVDQRDGVVLPPTPGGPYDPAVNPFAV